MAEVAVWLIDGADLVTGESILVDAGLHLGKFCCELLFTVGVCRIYGLRFAT